MFTGIVEEIGEVRVNLKLSGKQRLDIAASAVLSGLKLGDSISVNGACLTVIELAPDSFAIEAVPETLRRTNLAALEPGDGVNLERALAADGRFGGHIVQGHVEAVGTVTERVADGAALRLKVAVPEALGPAIVPQGFIAVDGVSLTVVDCAQGSFTVSIIPFTQQHTTLGSARDEQSVNIETDIVARYVERLVVERGVRSG